MTVRLRDGAAVVPETAVVPLLSTVTATDVVDVGVVAEHPVEQ